jgi:hypothetical protein
MDVLTDQPNGQEIEDDDGDDDPTGIAYGELQAAFEHFNIELFDTRLPPCLITLQRKRGSFGYFSPPRFGNKSGDITDEIALNPMMWRHLPVDENLRTLVHEMVHLEQHHFGKPSRRGYHNKEFAALMLRIGVIPSHNGKPGGRMTGQQMMDYADPGGRFEKSFEAFIALGYDLTYFDRFDETPAKERNLKTKYTCPLCGDNAWGKPGLGLVCGTCLNNVGRLPPELQERDPRRDPPRARELRRMHAPLFSCSRTAGVLGFNERLSDQPIAHPTFVIAKRAAGSVESITLADLHDDIMLPLTGEDPGSRPSSRTIARFCSRSSYTRH